MTYTAYLPHITHTTPLALTHEAMKLADAVNVMRWRYGVPSLTVHNRLCKAAQSHADDMRDRGYVAHDTLDGPLWGERVQEHYPEWRWIGELIATSDSTAAQAVGRWTAEPSNKETLLLYQFKHIGVGYASGGEHGHYWVAVLGTDEFEG